MNETSQAATSGAKPDSGIKIGDSIVVRFLDDNKTTSFVLSRDRHDAELLEERYEEARHVIAGSAERKAKMIVEPRHLDRRNGTLTVSLPGNASHVHF